MVLEKLFFIPDTHVPFEDKRAFRLVLKAIKAFRPDHLVILGDFLDCFAISAHTKDFKKRPSFREELLAGSAALALLESSVSDSCKRYYVEGNHENRLSRYLSSDRALPVLKPLVDAGLIDLDKVTIPALLDLKKRGWVWAPYKEHLKIGKLHVTHDVGKAGIAAHLDAEATFQSNAVIGHTHRLNYAVRGNMRGKAHVGAMFGWLGDVCEVDYMYRARALRDWSLGFGVGYKEPNGTVHLTPVPMVDYRCMLEGKLVCA